LIFVHPQADGMDEVDRGSHDHTRSVKEWPSGSGSPELLAHDTGSSAFPCQQSFDFIIRGPPFLAAPGMSRLTPTSGLLVTPGGSCTTFSAWWVAGGMATDTAYSACLSRICRHVAVSLPWCLG
jgi:hypothetical protein